MPADYSNFAKSWHKAYQNGTQLKDIAQQFGITAKTVANYIKRAGYELKDPRRIDNKDRILELHLERYSPKDIASLVGCSASTVIRHLEKNGLYERQRKSRSW